MSQSESLTSWQDTTSPTSSSTPREGVFIWNVKGISDRNISGKWSQFEDNTLIWMSESFSTEEMLKILDGAEKYSFKYAFEKVPAEWLKGEL